MSEFPKLAAIAVLLKDQQVLLVRRRNEPDAGLWGFPGGHVEPGETALSAATRELCEETGIVANPVKYLTNLDIIERDVAGKITFHFLLAAVLCDYISGHPEAGDDVMDAGWFPVRDIFDNRLATSKNVDDVLRLARSDFGDRGRDNH